jgi:tetratricopeptide (TPR) repeat protein
LSELDPKSINAGEDLVRFYQGGEARLVQARLVSAEDYFSKALKVFRKVSDNTGTALCLLKLGRVLELLGEYDKALEIYKESRAFYTQLNDHLGIARSKAFLGNVAWAKGDYASAKTLLEDAQKYFKEVGDVPCQAWMNDLMGNLLLAEGRDMEAESCYQTAFAMARALGESPEGLAWNEYHLAAIKLFRRDYGSARNGFLNALKIFIEMKDVLGQVATFIHLCEIDCEERDFTAAEKYIVKSIKMVIPTQCKPLLADALTGLARLLKAKGEDRKAIGILMFALSHPTCRQQTKDRMVSLSESLEANFSKQEIERGFSWAKDFTIEEMASSWLKAISSKSKKMH